VFGCARYSRRMHIGRPGRRPLVRVALVVSAAVAVVSTIVIAGTAQGNPVQHVRVLSGAAWLASPQVGQVTLLDGASAEVAAQLQVAPNRNNLDVVQEGANAYAVDSSAGTIRRIDGATFEPAQPASPIPDIHNGLTVFASPVAVYAMDTQRGILATTDPYSLERRRPFRSRCPRPTPRPARRSHFR
jgi:hypothetical protein